MKKRRETMFALLAAAVIACELASAIAVRVGPVRGVPGSFLVALTRNTGEGKGGVALLFTEIPTGSYAVTVLTRRD